MSPLMRSLMRPLTRPSRLAAALLVAALAAPPLAAHPHIFVATGLKLLRGESGLVEGVEITWRYDALYSLLVLEDMELDADFDGRLTAAELQVLNGFDLNWVEGFEGDLYAKTAKGALGLGPPERRGTRLEKGEIVSRHYRALTPPARAFSLKAFDPTYYTAYDLGLGVDLPAGCEARVLKADVSAASQKVFELMGDAVDDPDADYPEVGEDFADEIMIRCAAAS